jgi:hypothetical protein
LDELERLPPENRSAPEVFLQRLGIFIGLKRWEEAAKLAEGMLAREYRYDSTFLLGAYAIRRHRSLEEATRSGQSGARNSAPLIRSIRALKAKFSGEPFTPN